ncbi:MAG: hypothetical protein RXR82_08065 [Nitrososphaeria archaeon]
MPGVLHRAPLPLHMPWGRTGGSCASPLGFAAGDGLQVPDYSTMSGRVNGLRVDLGDSPVESNGPVSIAVDASGIEVHDGGDWIRRVRKVRKGYLKIHDAGDGRRLRGPWGRGGEGREGPRRRRLRLEGELQLPRGGGNGAGHRGRRGSGSAPRSGDLRPGGMLSWSSGSTSRGRSLGSTGSI